VTSFKQSHIYSETHSLTFYCGNKKIILKPQDRTLNEVRCAAANSPLTSHSKMKGNEMSEACSTRGTEDIYLLPGNPERTDQIESIRVEGVIILKWMLQVQDAKLSAGLICVRTGNRGWFW